MISLTAISWPESRVDQALSTLCQLSSHIRRNGVDRVCRMGHGRAVSAEQLDHWMEQAAAASGVEIEPIETSYGEVARMLRGAGPALLRIEDGERFRLLLVLGCKRHKLLLIAPDGRTRPVALDAVRSVLCTRTEATAEGTLRQILKHAAAPMHRQLELRGRILSELLSSARIKAGWMVRTSPDTSALTQVHQLRLPRLLLSMISAHVIYCALWVLSWWLLGWLVFQGRLVSSWLWAWGLIVVSLIPFRVLVTSTAGRLVVRGSALLKRRLLFNTLRLDADRLRRFGSGQLLGRVLESETLDYMALGGGVLGVTALVELLFAGLVLSQGVAAISHLCLLVATLLLALLLVVMHYRRRDHWTRQRVALTDDVVERMIGHRTRLAQQPPQHWHNEEDQLLAAYSESSILLDRSLQWLKVLIPRGWFLLGVLVVAPAFAYGEPSSAVLGISIGGMLLGYRAFRDLTEGMERLTGSAVAWKRIKLFWADGIAPNPAAPHLLESAQDGHQERFVLDARDLVFRYPGREEPLLRGATLNIREGEKIVLQGLSGDGKTTLGALLSGLRSPGSGVLLLNGIDRQTRGDLAWRKRVAMTPQFHDNHVLMGTLAFNLLMGKRWPPEAEDLQEAEQVCHGLGLQPLLDRMPAGLHQMVGETGWQLSHGERSRLYVARAILQRADLLILDESFAALDPDTLLHSLGVVLEKCPTVLVIAHP